MKDPKIQKKAPLASECNEVLSEDLITLVSLTAEQMQELNGGAGATAQPNYFQQGGPFTHDQKANIFYSQTEMSTAAGAANSEFADTTSRMWLPTQHSYLRRMDSVKPRSALL